MAHESIERVEQDEHLSGEAAIERVRELLAGFRAAMFVTKSLDGPGVHARPLAIQGDGSTFAGTLWFFVDDRSPKVQEMEQDAHVSLIFQSDHDSQYLQLVGSAAVVRDRAKMEELYTIRVRTWFPEGLDDPHLVLIRFDAERGSSWDSPGGMLQVLAAFTKAVVTRTPGRSGRAGTMDL